MPCTLSRPVGIKDWLNWTIYFGCLELCNLWYSLSCVTVVISNYNYRRLALLTPHYVCVATPCDFFVFGLPLGIRIYLCFQHVPRGSAVNVVFGYCYTV